MFATMRIFNVIKKNYNIEFTRILSDNGAEFTFLKKHPFEMDIIRRTVIQDHIDLKLMRKWQGFDKQ